MDVKEPFQMHGVIGGSKTWCSIIDRHIAVGEGGGQFFNSYHVSSSTPQNNMPPQCPFILSEVSEVRKVKPLCESEELPALKM